MAFKAIESLKIISGEVAPSVPFIDLVAQIALEKSIWFIENQKVIPALPEIPTPLEESNRLFQLRYSNKLEKISEAIVQNQKDLYQILVKIVVTQLSETYTFTMFVDGVDNFWENKVTDEMIASLELLAKIKPEEKAAYDLIA